MNALAFAVSAGGILAAAVIVIALLWQQRQDSMSKKTGKSLYDRLGGIYAIAAVVDHFSDSLIDNPVVGKNSSNPQLRQWHSQELGRLAGLKFMRTLWVADITGGPYKYVPTVAGKTRLNLKQAHCPLKVSSAEFDEVARVLGQSLDHFQVPSKEKSEVLAAFAAHKKEVIACSR